MAHDQKGWEGKLFLRFKVSGGRTVLMENRHSGSMRVQRAFYPESDGRAHVYLLHLPGGFVGGDKQSVELHCEEYAEVLITTPSATKCYRSLGPFVDLQQTLYVAKNASLEWFPQETIVFDGAYVRSSTRVELHPEAEFLGWDIVCLGRLASGDLFGKGLLEQRFTVWRGDKPLWVERASYQGGSSFLHKAYGLSGRTVVASFICTRVDQSLVDALRHEVDHNAELLSVSRNDDILLVRYVGDSAERARAIFIRLWHIIKRMRFGTDACEPAIWRT